MQSRRKARLHLIFDRLAVMVTVSGSIEDVVFYNPENGYSVLALNCQSEMLTVVGTSASSSRSVPFAVSCQWISLVLSAIWPLG
jgi:hypothetical protein